MPIKHDDFVEELFEYDWDEYQLWNRGDIKLIDGFNKRTGLLGRGSEVNVHQTGKPDAILKKGEAPGGQNYPENRYAVHLIEEMRFPSDGVFYENYTLSARGLELYRGKPNLKHARGAEAVEAVFSDKFFQKFDRLYEHNKKSVKREGPHTMLVDLCAIDRPTRRVWLVEIKKYNQGATKHEVLGRHQLLTLAFVRHLVGVMGEAAFRDGVWNVEAKVVSFVVRGDFYQRIDMKPAPIDFTV